MLTLEKIHRKIIDLHVVRTLLIQSQEEELTFEKNCTIFFKTTLRHVIKVFGVQNACYFYISSIL